MFGFLERHCAIVAALIVMSIYSGYSSEGLGVGLRLESERALFSTITQNYGGLWSQAKKTWIKNLNLVVFVNVFSQFQNNRLRPNKKVSLK